MNARLVSRPLTVLAVAPTSEAHVYGFKGTRCYSVFFSSAKAAEDLAEKMAKTGWDVMGIFTVSMGSKACANRPVGVDQITRRMDCGKYGGTDRVLPNNGK